MRQRRLITRHRPSTMPRRPLITRRRLTIRPRPTAITAAEAPPRQGLVLRSHRSVTTHGGADVAALPARRGGRPSQEEAARLADHILEVATELFLAEGYGATSIEAVAQ